MRILVYSQRARRAKRHRRALRPYAQRWRTVPAAPTRGTAARMYATTRLLSGLRRRHRAVQHSGRAGNLKMGLAEGFLQLSHLWSPLTEHEQRSRTLSKVFSFVSCAPFDRPTPTLRAPARCSSCSPSNTDHKPALQPLSDRAARFLGAGARSSCRVGHPRGARAPQRSTCKPKRCCCCDHDHGFFTS